MGGGVLVVTAWDPQDPSDCCIDHSQRAVLPLQATSAAAGAAGLTTGCRYLQVVLSVMSPRKLSLLTMEVARKVVFVEVNQTRSKKSIYKR